MNKFLPHIYFLNFQLHSKRITDCVKGLYQYTPYISRIVVCKSTMGMSTLFRSHSLEFLACFIMRVYCSKALLSDLHGDYCCQYCQVSKHMVYHLPWAPSWVGHSFLAPVSEVSTWCWFNILCILGIALFLYVSVLSKLTLYISGFLDYLLSVHLKETILNLFCVLHI